MESLIVPELGCVYTLSTDVKEIVSYLNSLPA